MKTSHVVVFIAGVTCGLACLFLLSGAAPPAGVSSHTAGDIDPRQTGLPKSWLVFGFAGQALFTGRMLVQWLATERKRMVVVPTLFWWLSLFGGLILFVYFFRRGDPVGALGQLFGAAVYVRNLLVISRMPPPAPAPG